MIKEWKVKRFSIFLCLALALTCSSAAEALEINGGTTWNGWTSVGFSNQLGIYGSGATTDVYEIYTASFLFNNETKSGGAVGGGPTGGVTGFGTGSFSTGSFVNGNSMLGIGVRRVSGSAFSSATIATVRFDLDNDNYVAASSVGGTDGRTSFTQYSHFRDLNLGFSGAPDWRGNNLTMQAGTGTFWGGPNDPQTIQGGIGSGVSYDWPFRIFSPSDTANSYQMIFDLTAMQSIYGTGNPNPFAKNANFTGIGPFGSTATISLNGLGTNNVVFLAPVPEPSGFLLGSAGAVLLALIGRRHKRET